MCVMLESKLIPTALNQHNKSLVSGIFHRQSMVARVFLFVVLLVVFLQDRLLVWSFSTNNVSTNNKAAPTVPPRWQLPATLRRDRKYHRSIQQSASLVFAVTGGNNDHDSDDDDSSPKGDDDKPPNTKDGDSIPNIDDVPLPQASKYMTAMEIDHRQQEIELLGEIATNPDIIWEFRKLWRSERGTEVEEKVLRAWKDMGHPDLWNNAERDLLKLIEDDPTYLYPFVFLSKLYCLQGKFQESQHICKSILQLKPYHFVVIETMIANSFALQSMDDAAYWQTKRLPPPTHQDARKAWTIQAIEDATRILDEAKESNKPQTEIGSYDYDGIERSDDNDDNSNKNKDAWQ